jgi:hypothetical protein
VQLLSESNMFEAVAHNTLSHHRHIRNVVNLFTRKLLVRVQIAMILELHVECLIAGGDWSWAWSLVDKRAYFGLSP